MRGEIPYDNCQTKPAGDCNLWPIAQKRLIRTTGHVSVKEKSEEIGVMLSPYIYGVYGVSLQSEIPLCLPEPRGLGPTTIHLSLAEPETFARAIAGADLIPRADWYQYAHLADGSSYVCWVGLGEFLVSAGGKKILCRRDPDAPMESFQVYLLGQALSFALVKAGFEPLHGTAVVHDGEAIVLLGDSGHGKSTLAASFLSSGCTLLTDDLLLIRPTAGTDLAYPGPARIKLFPDSARRFLDVSASAIGVPMNPTTEKHIIPIESVHRCFEPVPIRAMYVLAPPHEMRYQRKVSIQTLSRRLAFLALVENTFNRYISDPARMRRQLTELTTLIQSIPVSKLSYPRSINHLSEVRHAILSDADPSVNPLSLRISQECVA